jgi:hypothetical protein
MDAPELQRFADIQVDLVRPEQQGFILSGQGNDRAEYRLEVHFDMPLDGRTRAVLGELLAQSEVSIWRGPAPAPVAAPPRSRAPRRHPRRRIAAD